MARTIHIIGAGLAAFPPRSMLSLRGETVAVHEATTFAGGRCRSYHDSVLGMTIDNGNHLVLSGNHAALRYLQLLARRTGWSVLRSRSFRSSIWPAAMQWTLRINDGRFPWWIFKSSMRVPGTHAFDYLPLTRLLWPSATARGRRGRPIHRAAL